MGLRRELRVALAVALFTIPSVARGDPDFVVTRANGAAGCPDGLELRRLATASASPSSPSPTHAYRVSFDRSGSGYRVELVDVTTGRARRLEDAGPSCGALAQASAVVLATMWSSERTEATAQEAATSPAPEPSSPQPAAPLAPATASEPPPTAPPPPPPPPPHDRPTTAEQPTTADEPSANTPPLPSRRPRWVFGAGAGLAAGIVRPAAPTLLGDAGIEWGHASFAVGVAWIPVQDLDVAPGSVGVQLVAASLRACGFVGQRTQFGACAQGFVGELHAAGAGHTLDASHDRPWLAAEPEVFVDRPLFGHVRGRATAGAVVPLRAETFSIRGAGLAYDTPAVGGVFTLSIELATP